MQDEEGDFAQCLNEVACNREGLDDQKWPALLRGLELFHYRG